MEVILSWINPIKTFAGVALALGFAGTAVAGTIVIRAEGPSKAIYPAGKALSGRVALRPGDTLVVLDAKGTRTLKGPGTIDLAAASTAAPPSALIALIRNTGARQVRTGAVRGANTGAAASPNLWYVDAARGGTVCLPDLSRATVWRAAMTDPVTMTLTRTSDGKAVPLVFAAGQSVRSWPIVDFPISEASEYRLSGPGLSKPVSIRFAQVALADDAPDAVASALISKGCNGQLDMLVAAGSAPATAG